VAIGQVDLSSRWDGGAADLVVAGAAVDRPIAAWNEGDFRHHTAVGAGSRVHLSGRLAAEARKDAVADISVFGLNGPGGTTRSATARATRRFVLQSFGCVKLLLTGSKDEAAAAVLTNDFFIRECQLLCNLPMVGPNPANRKDWDVLRQVSISERIDPLVFK
jgi:hypothetical protein